jgi:hypothetical protein
MYAYCTAERERLRRSSVRRWQQERKLLHERVGVRIPRVAEYQKPVVVAVLCIDGGGLGLRIPTVDAVAPQGCGREGQTRGVFVGRTERARNKNTREQTRGVSQQQKKSDRADTRCGFEQQQNAGSTDARCVATTKVGRPDSKTVATAKKTRSGRQRAVLCGGEPWKQG